MASISSKTILLFSFLFILFNISESFDSFNVVDLGADPKGITDSTSAFEAAWSKACGSLEPVGMYVPGGTFLLNLTKFEGPCKNNAITIQIDGTLIAPTDYNVLGSETSWIQIHQVDGLSIKGGVIDGKGNGLWDCKKSKKSCPIGATNFGIFKSKHINISSLTSQNSQMFHMVIHFCQNVSLERVKILAPENSPNTDGVHIQASSFISILNSNISTGDDCVSIGPGSNNLWMQQVSCGPGHGISIGGLGREVVEEGVHNVVVTAASFIGTQNGVRIKSLGTPCSSLVNEVLFQHVTMIDVQNPIIIDQNYCAGGEGCTGKPSHIQLSNISYNDIHGSSATDVAVKFDCSPKKPCNGLLLQNINLTYNGKTARASCVNAFGRTYGEVNPPSCLK